MGFAAEIAKVLARIEELLAQIEPLRKKADVLTRHIDQAQRDYEGLVGPANLESARLDAALVVSRRRLTGLDIREPAPLSGVGEQPTPVAVTPPQSWESVPERLPDDAAHTVRKRSIADHVLYFAAADNDPIVLLMNSMLARPEQRAGEMLEMIAWGDIWKAAPDWEPEPDRLDRLHSWQLELEDRWEYWMSRVQQLTRDPGHALAEKKRKLSRAKWREYLTEIALEQEADNSRHAAELQLLDAEWNRRQGGGAV